MDDNLFKLSSLTTVVSHLPKQSTRVDRRTQVRRPPLTTTVPISRPSLTQSCTPPPTSMMASTAIRGSHIQTPQLQTTSTTRVVISRPRPTPMEQPPPTPTTTAIVSRVGLSQLAVESQESRVKVIPTMPRIVSRVEPTPNLATRYLLWFSSTTPSLVSQPSHKPHHDRLERYDTPTTTTPISPPSRIQMDKSNPTPTMH
jgi:hypothetical protein